MWLLAVATCSLLRLALADDGATEVEAAADCGPPAAGRESPAMELMYMLVTTGTAIGIGFAAVQLRFVEPQRGDMAALRWYIGRVAFPLLIFKVVVTSEVGNLHLSLIFACTLGKLFVMAPTWVLTFCWYHRSHASTRKRVLTATCFAFFVVASDDFALGFPIVQAIYSSEQEMDLYVAANALMSNSVFMPIVMVLFEVGTAMGESHKGGANADSDGEFDQEEKTGDEKSDGEKSDESVVEASARLRAFSRVSVASGLEALRAAHAARRSSLQSSRTSEEEEQKPLSMVPRTCKRILLNPVILCMGIGALYKNAFGSQFPVLVGKILEKLTSPFGTLALFATGTVLRSPSLQFWPCLLSVFKVIVCAYVSFFVARQFEPSADLADFSFFYGCIPTSSAPLLFAVQYDPGAVDTVASATLFGLILAGPAMLSTSLFLDSDRPDPDILGRMQQYVSICSLVFGFAFDAVLLFLAANGRWGFSNRGMTALAVYGVTASIYTFFMWRSSFAECGPDGGRYDSLDTLMLSWLGRSISCLLVLMQAMTVPWAGEVRVQTWHEVAAVCSILALTLVSALLLPAAQSIDMQCTMELQGHIHLLKIVWNCVLLGLLAGLGVLRMSKRSNGRKATGDWGQQSWGMEWHLIPPTTVIRALVFLRALHGLVAIVDSAVQWAGWSLKGSFVSMLLLEGCLEHATSGLLFAVLLFTSSFCRELRLLWEEKAGICSVKNMPSAWLPAVVEPEEADQFL